MLPPLFSLTRRPLRRVFAQSEIGPPGDDGRIWPRPRARARSPHLGAHRPRATSAGLAVASSDLVGWGPATRAARLLDRPRSSSQVRAALSDSRLLTACRILLCPARPVVVYYARLSATMAWIASAHMKQSVQLPAACGLTKAEPQRGRMPAAQAHSGSEEATQVQLPRRGSVLSAWHHVVRDCETSSGSLSPLMQLRTAMHMLAMARLLCASLQGEAPA